MRRLVLVLLGVAGVVGLLRLRRSREFVDVQFEDGAAVRLARGVEALDLLDDAYAILGAAG